MGTNLAADGSGCGSGWERMKRMVILVGEDYWEMVKKLRTLILGVDLVFCFDVWVK